MNKTSVTANKSRSFFKKSFEDALWLRTQPISVRILWDDAAMSDPFGEKWNRLETVVEGSTFRAARKTLEKYGAFEFRVKPSGRDHRKTAGWEVKNLHGAYTAYYTEISAENSAPNSQSELPTENDKIPARNSASIAEHSAGNTQIAAKNSAGIAEHSAPNSSETLSLVQPCLPLRSKEDQIKEINEDLPNCSSEKRSGRSAASALGASGDSPGASDIVEKSGATHQSENLEKAEATLTSSKSENKHRREEVESGHQPKSFAPPRSISPQSDVRSNENALEQDSAASKVQTDSQAAQHASSALPAATEPQPKRHLFDEVVKQAMVAAKEKGVKYSDEFWRWFIYNGRANNLAPVRLGLEKAGVSPDHYAATQLCDYLFHEPNSGYPGYCWNATMNLKVWFDN